MGINQMSGEETGGVVEVCRKACRRKASRKVRSRGVVAR